jgi:hypothetical protein
MRAAIHASVMMRFASSAHPCREFYGLAEQPVPEDVNNLMNRGFELMLAEIHRFDAR